MVRGQGLSSSVPTAEQGSTCAARTAAPGPSLALSDSILQSSAWLLLSSKAEAERLVTGPCQQMSARCWPGQTHQQEGPQLHLTVTIVGQPGAHKSTVLITNYHLYAYRVACLGPPDGSPPRENQARRADTLGRSPGQCKGTGRMLRHGSHTHDLSPHQTTWGTL